MASNLPDSEEVAKNRQSGASLRYGCWPFQKLPMTSPKLSWEISIGAIIHTLVLITGMGICYGAFSAKVEYLFGTIEKTERQTDRIEHYLSSEDPNYWKKVTQNGDADERLR